MSRPGRRRRAAACAVLLMAACKSSPRRPPPGEAPDQDAAAAAVAELSPNQLFGRGVPTFIVGTAGDAATTAAIRTQATMVRDLLFPAAAIVADADVPAAPASWPPRPVVYGGRHVNSLVARLDLPIAVDAGRLRTGDVELTGGDLAVYAAIPAGVDHPELVLLAGTGTPGIDGINSGAAVGRGADAIVIADRFGVRQRGRWTGSAAAPRADLGAPAVRPTWRATTRVVGTVTVHVQIDAAVAPAADDEVITAVVRGVTTSRDALRLASPAELTVHVHADRERKQQATGDAGDGHAVGFARTVHVFPSSVLEPLIAHEATHVLAAIAWGGAGSSLFGEGLAVWAAGGYAGVPLATARARLLEGPPPPAPTALLGAGFRQLPEGQAYPLAGVLVERVVAEIGIDGLIPLYRATPSTWADACRQAGTTPEAVATWLPGAGRVP